MPEYFVVRYAGTDDQEAAVLDMVIYTDTRSLAAALREISKNWNEDWAVFERVGNKMTRRAIIFDGDNCEVQ